MKNIVLIGMMGCGKTTVGGLLARTLGRELADTDSLIEERVGCAVSQLIAREGEAVFREWERTIAEELSRREGLIVSCGGGLPMADERISPLKGSGVVIWLKREPGETYDGLDVSGRPLAQGGREAFVSLAEQRFPTYQRWADHVISAPSPDIAAAEILALLEGTP